MIDIDAAVNAAIAEYEAWHREALPGIKPEPRVFVSDGGTKVHCRRPFKSKGHWRVRLAGTARLTNPHTVDGATHFVADYGRP